MNINEGKYYRVVLWILEGLATIGFIYLVIYFINAYSTYEILKSVPNDFKRGGDNNYLNPNEQGDTLGGILNPIIGIVAILVTYLAFFIQFLANKQVQNQFKIQQFESQFYEMLRIHKDNVNEMYLPSKNGENFNGRYVLESIYYELIFCYNSCKLLVEANYKQEINNPSKLKSSKSILTFVYKIWFFGTSNIDKTNFDFLEIECFDYLKRIQTIDSLHEDIKHSILKGNQSRLAHYYRHLFQTVKFVANQNEGFISYEDKRKYLRILRAQLSNYEQALLFFNWFSDFGYKWEEPNNLGNKFFTDYRIIHNLYPVLILKMFDLEEFKSNKIEKNRTKDSIFEYQDWGY